MGAAPPLTTLRDFLELAACDSAGSDGFRSYPRCRRSEVVDDRSLSAVFSPRRRSPSLATISRLSRTISRRLFFFRRRPGCGDDVDDERDSVGLPSPVVSSCSASECAESEPDHHLLASTSTEEDKSTSPSSSSSSSLVGTSTTGEEEDEHNKEMGGDGEPDAVGETMDQDKQQLSPVSVMDFPLDDEDDDGEEEEQRSHAGTCECSPASFQLQRPKTQRTIRRFEVDVPVDLDAIFVTESDGATDTKSRCSTETVDHGAAAAAPQSDEIQSAVVGEEDELRRQVAAVVPADDEHCCRVLARRLLKDTTVSSAADERLLADFFADGVDHRPRASPGGLLDDDDRLVRAAREWVKGEGTKWGLGDVVVSGETALADMEWMCVGEEERDVGVEVEGLLMDALLAEIVAEFLACR